MNDIACQATSAFVAETKLLVYNDDSYRVGFYEIEGTIGRGNFAVVKLARHRITKTEVRLFILVRFQLKPPPL